jgi:hypothetical protein
VPTSAIKTIVEHNRLIRRTPLTTPRVASKCSSKKRSHRLFTGPAITSCLPKKQLSPPLQPAGRVAKPFQAQPAEVSRVRADGDGYFNPTHPLLSIAIARDCSHSLS